jgi:hypothetical protein
MAQGCQFSYAEQAIQMVWRKLLSLEEFIGKDCRFSLGIIFFIHGMKAVEYKLLVELFCLSRFDPNVSGMNLMI